MGRRRLSQLALSVLFGCGSHAPSSQSSGPEVAVFEPPAETGSQRAAPEVAVFEPPAETNSQRSAPEVAVFEPSADTSSQRAAPEVAVIAPPAEPPSPPPATLAGSDTDWTVGAPRARGRLVGRTVAYPQADLKVFGSDLGFTFAHEGRNVVLFGDTWATHDQICDESARDDDGMATLPLEPTGEMPSLQFFTEPDAPTAFRAVQLFRHAERVPLHIFRVPVAGFSDGGHAYGLFQTQEVVRCDEQPCPAQAGVMCTGGVALCDYAPATAPVSCELANAACLVGQCPGTADVCVDHNSSAYDGSLRGRAASVLTVVDIARSRPDAPTQFDSVATWKTNVFSHPTVRTVARFSGRLDGNDYSPGAGSLLIWGRPGMSAEQGRQARVYLAVQALPLERHGKPNFEPRYFAGVDPETLEPRWTNEPGAALPLAMDGEANGDSSEERSIVGTTSVSWLGAPVNRWVMMYGGDLPDRILVDPAGSRASDAPGAIVMRFAEHPWGPWSSAIPHLQPGSPARAGDAYGPGGMLFHPYCRDTAEARCAEGDLYQVSLLGRCSDRGRTELGRLYAPNIIDSFTRPNSRGGLDFTWVVSTWNPYGVTVMQSSVDPAMP